MISTQLSAQSIRLAVISEGVNSWPLYVAQAQRLFEREDINVATTLTGSSVRQLAQLTRGDFDIGIQQSDHIVRGVESGSDLFVFMAHAHAPELSLVVAPAINSFADLGGRDIAVDGARTGYALLLRKLLADKGLQDGAYTFREIGGAKERLDSLRSGATFASFLNPPFDRNLFAAGFRSLGTTKDYFPKYPGSVAAARRSWAKENERRLVAFIRAFDAAYAWLIDSHNQEEAVRILTARLDIEAKAATAAYDKFVSLPQPAITPEALRQVIDVVWEAEGYNRAKGAPEKYMDLSFLKQAQQAR
jgi:ABC-type nitrate/sulfonate/bicarbonate transport system substrate-binding protein